MNDMKANLIWQLMQNMGISGDHQFTPESQEMPEPYITLDPPWDMLLMIRPMLAPREQRMIDLLIKMQEMRILMDDIQSGGTV